MFPIFPLCGFGYGAILDRVLSEYMPPAFARKYTRLSNRKKVLDKAEPELSAVVGKMVHELKERMKPEANTFLARPDYGIVEKLLHETLDIYPAKKGEVTVTITVTPPLSFTLSVDDWHPLHNAIMKFRVVNAERRTIIDELSPLTDVCQTFQHKFLECVHSWQIEDDIRRTVKNRPCRARELRVMFDNVQKAKKAKKQD